MSETDSTTVVSVPARPKRIWLYLLGVACLGTYAAAFIPAMSGEQPDSKIGPVIVFWTAIFCSFLWRRQGRKGWHGVLVGVLVGILVFALAAFVGGFMRASAGS